MSKEEFAIAINEMRKLILAVEALIRELRMAREARENERE